MCNCIECSTHTYMYKCTCTMYMYRQCTIHAPLYFLPHFLDFYIDDDAFIEDPDSLENHLLADVGTIWRGTSRQPSPILWEYGQVSVPAIVCQVHTCTLLYIYLYTYCTRTTGASIIIQIASQLQTVEYVSLCTCSGSTVCTCGLEFIADLLMYFFNDYCTLTTQLSHTCTCMSRIRF